jgi:hypothetical protein
MTLPVVVPLDTDEYWADPYPILAEIRERHGTAVTPDGQKVVLRWDDAAAVKASPLFENEGLEYVEARGFKPGDPLYEWRRWSIGARNGDDHRRLRSLVNRALTPRAVEAVRPLVGEHTRAVLAQHVGDDGVGELDAKAVFRRIPFFAITAFLGIDLDEAMQVGAAMGTGAADAFGPNVTQELRDRANGAFATVTAFVGELVEQRRREPRDDLLTRLLDAEEDGERLSHDELVSMIMLLLIAGHDTTKSLISSGLWVLLRHPEQADRLRADDALAASAIEELLRFESPLHVASGGGRWPRQPIELHGQVLEPGTPVRLLLGSANHDPAAYDRPDHLDLARSGRPHLAFGRGLHHCLGAPLGRLEGQIVIPAVLRAFPDLAMVDPVPRWRHSFVVRQLSGLAVRTG